MADLETPDASKEVAARRKTAAQKDHNRMFRQQQISSYKAAMLKEARAQRSRRRHGKGPENTAKLAAVLEPLEGSPKKRKKVNFNLQAPGREMALVLQKRGAK
ncbi:hypothetical protein METBIDRAFT_10013 [Metschnikowia bicuspidata var. bicuspidata NRRL YB-4993]|uniref:Uncharacterized protein n=1 Tax=Metschnikowia bicuspidata var. bicuspidata NRRL YB-4993 TaxID=869754 RepID=A0A1A0HIX3_9ASCO|nr:hypothetical protein METBIDRAFT_10013 [Metschnikowia bicuspidata var. bicuspidata NRRL YB-4993]OBA23788.1 hypothetical protein METBIDRAFT_10013 [Metschnikowia bicuspidata var. bicuspidata NRRL YB-4993]